MLEPRFGGDAADTLDEQFAFVVVRMRLPCEDELHGPLRIVEDFIQPVDILEQQRGALVGGEPASKADSQRR